MCFVRACPLSSLQYRWETILICSQSTVFEHSTTFIKHNPGVFLPSPFSPAPSSYIQPHWVKKRINRKYIKKRIMSTWKRTDINLQTGKTLLHPPVLLLVIQTPKLPVQMSQCPNTQRQDRHPQSCPLTQKPARCLQEMPLSLYVTHLHKVTKQLGISGSWRGQVSASLW